MRRLFAPVLVGLLLLGCGGAGGGGGDSLPIGDNYANLMRLTYWPNRPVSVAFEKSGTYSQAFEDHAKESFEKWIGPTGRLVDFFYVAPNQNPDILVRFKPSASEDSDDIAGITTLLIQGDSILDVTIDISTRLSLADFRRTSTHEMGHAYGLTGGHSDQRSDIMYAYLTTVNDPSERDINTMRMAYVGRRGVPDPDAPVEVWRIVTTDEGCTHVKVR